VILGGIALRRQGRSSRLAFARPQRIQNAHITIGHVVHALIEVSVLSA
jgi:hypothetical protein